MIKLSIQGLSKTFQNGDGVKEIDLQVKQGELVTLLGPSGCGKTTILRAVGGFHTIDSGSILLDGEEISSLPPEKRPTAMVFQGYNLWPHMTIYDNLAFGLRLCKVKSPDIASQVKAVLSLVQIPGCEKKYPSQLSGGQQQRVAIARALLLEPSLLLLDEPFSALDAKIRSEMREELKKIQQKLDITILFVTHDQEEAMAISDRIVVMNKGSIEQIGTPTQIYDNPATQYVASFIGNMNFFRQGENTLAVRPEDISLSTGDDGDIHGRVSVMMVLGHYVEISVESEDQNVRVFLPRSAAGHLHINDNVSLQFNKTLQY